MGKIVSSFIEYWGEVRKLLPKNEDEILFLRGQSNADYQLCPGICRGDSVDEQGEYRQIQIDYPEEFNKNTHLSNLVKMQHYGLNSRLLDFSLNPLVALYFAVEFNPDKNGKVFAIRVPKKEILFQNSDKALMLSCLPAFSKEEQNEIKKFCQAHQGEITDQDIMYSKVMRRFMHEIRGEYPAFETAIVGKDLLNYYFICPHKDNERMKAQDGAFAIFGLGEERLVKEITDSAQIIEIDSSAKKEILKELDFMKINSSFIYPGLERKAILNRGKKVDWINV